MQITGTLKVVGRFHYLITSDNKKYLIMSDVVNKTHLIEGHIYLGKVNNERVIEIK